MNLLIKFSSQKELEQMTKVFREIDKDNTGLINASELREFIKKTH
jgi:Ca2+-binding EF-hand superfamily protein